MKLGETIYEKTVPERKGIIVDFPENLNNEIVEFLKEKNINGLYSHQKEMFELASSGNNCVITTSTASGKTLSFLLPIINRILENPRSRAIFIYPTKALASDQYRAIKPFLDYFGSDRIVAGVYDGDTPVNERGRLRASANIILTNPEMINASFLPNHSKYNNNFIFANLEFVVIDELHTYKGAFGSHICHIFKRLHRICNFYNSKPIFLCSTATIANPVELASNICSEEFKLISKDGSPAAKKTYKFIQPAFYKNTDYKIPAIEVASNLLPELVVNGNSFIAFCKSRRAVETLLTEARERLKYDGSKGRTYEDKIAGYRGGYTPNERKAIEKKMINGKLSGLISTNALELGIDIGKVDSTVLIGYPKTVSSFFQQSGRAGRKGNNSTTYMILDNTAKDQFISIDPEWLFNAGSESAVLDTDNLYIQLSHLRAAAAELPLSLDDITFFTRMGEIIPTLLKIGELRKENAKYNWCGNAFPAGDFSLRNIDTEVYHMIDTKEGKGVTELDEIMAFRDCHNQSIYIHEGQIYMVDKLSIEEKKIYVHKADINYFTVPYCVKEIKIINNVKSYEFGKTKISFGDINVTGIFSGHKKVQFNNHQNLGYEDLDKPLTKSFETESVWIKIPSRVTKLLNRLMPPLEDTKDQLYYTYFDGMAFSILNSAYMATMADEEDISSAYNIDENLDTNIFIYDNYRGGLGFASKLYDKLEKLINNSIDQVKKCPCKNGCIACIGDYHLDKKVVLWALENLFIETKEPISDKIAYKTIVNEVTKEFSINDINKSWDKITNKLVENNEYLSRYLNNNTKAKLFGTRIVIYVKDGFEKELLADDANIKQLRNILFNYIDMPFSFELEIAIDE